MALRIPSADCHRLGGRGGVLDSGGACRRDRTVRSTLQPAVQCGLVLAWLGLLTVADPAPVVGQLEASRALRVVDGFT